MHEDINLVSDLALILISAGVITLLFRWLKQPLILGYIVAGFLVGPHFGLFPNVTSVETVDQWSEIGIIFLLFALGLEFSFKKLMKVGSSALITAVTIFFGMFFTGMIVGSALHWTSMESIFLGGMLSMSSTTIIIKAFDDLGLKKKPFTSIVFGTLVIEDLLAILLMVLLSTLAVSKHFEGMEMLKNLLKLAFFLILWFVVGIFLIPSLLRRAHKMFNDETILVLSVGLCFGMVALASYAGFSSALGAFIMGSILAETIDGERIAKTIKGIKDLFGAIFFVSVGMMVDPQIIAQYWQPILILMIVVMIGITFFATSGVLLAGKPLKDAVRSGFSMAQIGEFAFIIAALGSSLGVMRSFIYPVIVAVSVITTFTTPYFIKMSEPVSEWLSKHLPKAFLRRIELYSSSSKNPSSKPNDWKRLLQSYIIRIVLYSVLLFAISFACSKYLYPFLAEEFPNIGTVLMKWICVAISYALMSPFIYGLAVNKGSLSTTFEKLWYGKSSNKAPLVSLIVLRVLIAVIFCVSIFFHYFEFSYWVLIAVTIGIAVVIMLCRKALSRFEYMERRFYRNLNEKEIHESRIAPIKTSIDAKLSGHDIHVEKVVVSSNSPHIGKLLKEIPFRQLYGVNIVKIIRGNKVISLPSGDERIYPSDTIYAIGTDQQIAKFEEVMEADDTAFDDINIHPNVVVTSFILAPESNLTNKTLATSEARNSGCMIIGVERGSDSVMNPSPDFKFENKDVVWIVGEESACTNYINL